MKFLTERAFISSYGPERVFSIEEAVEQLLGASFTNSPAGVPADIRNNLVSNYPQLTNRDSAPDT